MRSLLGLLLALAFILPAFGQQPCSKCGKIHPAGNYAAEYSEAGAAAKWVVNRDPAAYAHALREARLLASRRYRGNPHPLGVAPGCRVSGSGYNHSPVPNHCYMPGWRRGRQRGLPDDRIVARACVYSEGRYYWSAHYR